MKHARGTLWTPVPILLLALAAACFGASGCAHHPDPPPRSVVAEAGIREGDVLFQTRAGTLGDMIRHLTGSPYNHCGIVLREADGALVVLESDGRVRRTPLRDWIAAGAENRLAVYRFVPAYQSMMPIILTRMRMYEGRPYDHRFRLDDPEAVYAAELLYRGFRDATGQRLGMTVRLMDLPWQRWRAEIERLEGGAVPVERELIPPRNIAAARQLEKVWSNYPPPW